MVQRKIFKVQIKNPSHNRANHCLDSRAHSLIVNVFFILVLIILLYKLGHHANVDFRKIVTCSPGAKFAENKYATTRLVWPEELPGGDRIIEQMFYVPKGYKYEATPIKRILIHVDYSDDNPKLDQEEFIGCGVSQCYLTADKSLGSEVDAVIFRNFYLRPQYKRPPNQIWILELSEAPATSMLYFKDFNVFNWTATYRWDSELPRPYGYFMDQKSPLPPKPRISYPGRKTKKVAWFVSNCVTSQDRLKYAAELSKYIDVDIYGACGKLECPRSEAERCFEMLDNDYKFYLSFENSHCRHYITEKLFLNALSHNVLPIVMGPRREDYELVAPNHSFIHVDDFASPNELAAYLHKLDKNDELYEEYFEWKHTGTIITDTQFYCRLCALLHDTDRPPKHYEDINDWWSGAGVCDKNTLASAIEFVKHDRQLPVNTAIIARIV